MQSVPEPIRPMPCYSVSYHLNASPVLSYPKHRSAIAAQFFTILFQRRHFFADTILFVVTPSHFHASPFLCYHFKRLFASLLSAYAVQLISKASLRIDFLFTSTPFTSSSSHRSRCQRLSFHPQQCQFISFHSGSAASAVPICS